MSWLLKENLQKQLKEEKGAQIYPAGLRNMFALVYPNSYQVGMSNLGFHILYQLINGRGDTACERVFLPDKKSLQEHVRTNTPILSLENQQPLYKFPLIGITVSFEMDYFNIFKILEMGKVRLKAAERSNSEPLIIAGGPCCTFNPEPLSEIIDAFVIGEGEETVMRILDTYYDGYKRGLSRQNILKILANIPGVYVPRFYQHIYNNDGFLTDITVTEGVPKEIHRQWIKNINQYEAQTSIITDDTAFKGIYLVEIARGCGRHCRFCMAGYCFRKPRNRSLEKLKKVISDAKKYNRKIGLMGAAISDYPEINQLCQIINELDLPMSVASFRADSVTKELVDALAKSGLKTLTLAPEAGSDKIRAVINKGITEEHLLHAIDLGVNAGIYNYRLYIMTGLPFEEDEDIEAIVHMAKKIKEYMFALNCKGTLTLSINPFIAKPFTPFQWLPMEEDKIVEKRLKYIQNALKLIKGIEVLVESIKESYIQGILARGDRKIAKVLCDACQMDGLKSFKRAMKENHLKEDFYLYRTRSENEIFPWDILKMGFQRDYLYQELLNAKKRKQTIRCFDGCKRCGVCD